MKIHKADLGNGWTMEPAGHKETDTLPDCPDCKIELVLVANSYTPVGRVLAAGCHQCRKLFDTQNGEIINLRQMLRDAGEDVDSAK